MTNARKQDGRQQHAYDTSRLGTVAAKLTDFQTVHSQSPAPKGHVQTLS